MATLIINTTDGESISFPTFSAYAEEEFGGVMFLKVISLWSAKYIPLADVLSTEVVV